jgi:glutamate synthase domain-containing protein 1
MTQRSRSTQGVYEQQYDHDGCGIGAVINISGQSDHDTIQRGRQILLNLRHRGAASGDDITGDGAGILIQVPHEFFTFISQEEGRILPNPGCYGVGMLFEPKDEVIAPYRPAL